MSATKPDIQQRVAASLDGERSRTRILDAAERLLAERGFSGTGIAAISRESGLPASSIYWFFSSKRDLTAAVVERAADRWIDSFEQAVGQTESGPISLRLLFDHGLAQSGSRLPDFMRLQVLLALERGDSDPDLRQRFERVSNRMRAVLAAAIAGGLDAEDKQAAKEVADEICFLARGLAMGTLISRQIEPEGIDSTRLSEDLEVAILAIARNRLRRGAH